MVGGVSLRKSTSVQGIGHTCVHHGVHIRDMIQLEYNAASCCQLNMISSELQTTAWDARDTVPCGALSFEGNNAWGMFGSSRLSDAHQTPAISSLEDSGPQGESRTFST